MNSSNWRWQQTVLIIALFLFAIISVMRLDGSRKSALAAAERLETCRDLAYRIQQLAQSPAQAWTETDAPFDQLRLELEQAVQELNIPTASLLSVDQQPARRLGKTAYLVEPAQIDLRGLTLRQLVELLDAIIAGQPGLVVQSIRLSAPRENKTSKNAESWTVEVILTHLIFSPE